MAAVATLLPVLTVVSGGPAAAHPAATTKSPLRVSIETLSPAVVPARGRVTITGRITNRSQEAWTALNAYMFTSPAPIVDRSGLAAAAATDEAAQVGSRITPDGSYDVV